MSATPKPTNINQDQLFLRTNSQPLEIRHYRIGIDDVDKKSHNLITRTQQEKLKSKNF